MLDIAALRSDLCQARQSNRKMVSVHVDDLQSLLTRAVELAAVQSMIPARVGYCRPEDLHALMDAEKFVIPMRRKKGNAYCVTMCANWIPPKHKPTE